MFACHGGQKILGLPPSERGLATSPLGLTSGWIELTCGLLLAVGLLTRLAAFIASGDLSHRLKPGAPAGFYPNAHFFDEEVVAAIRTAAPERVLMG